MLLFRLSLFVLCAAGLVGSVTVVPVYPCLILAGDYGAGGEGVGYHDTTPGNWGGFFVMNTAPSEWLGYDFLVDIVNTEYYLIPVLLRVTSGRRETRVGVDGATSRTFPIGTTPGAWTTRVVPIPYPAVGQHQLRTAFSDRGGPHEDLNGNGCTSTGWT